MTNPKHVSSTIKAEQIVGIIKDGLSGPTFDDPVIQAAHERDILETAERIIAAIQPDPEPVACPCTMIEQDESCPFGYPSLLCEDCDGIGILPAIPSSAGMVSVEAAARVLLEACPNPIFDVLKPALMGEIRETVWQTDEYGDEVSVDRQVTWDTMKTVIRAALRALAGERG